MKLIYQDRTETVKVNKAFDVVESLIQAGNLSSLLGFGAEQRNEEDEIAKVAYYAGLVVKGEDSKQVIQEAKSITGKVDDHRKVRGK